MEIKEYEGHGRRLMVEFACTRCKNTEYKPLFDCLPTEFPVRNLSDLKAPAGWRDGGFYYPTLCPKCKEKYIKFMSGEIG